MSEQELKQIKEIMVHTSVYYGRTLSPQVLAMMASDLSDLDFQATLDAFTKYRRDPKNRAFPLPAQIREIANPVVSDDNEAREVTGRIQRAIVRFGYTNPSDAQGFIGSLGWEVVKRWGGWPYLCQKLGTEIDTTHFSAQSREMVKSIKAYYAAGELDSPIMLESNPIKELDFKLKALCKQL